MRPNPYDGGENYIDYLQDILDSIEKIGAKWGGMRDKLIHDYCGVDTEVIWKTATNDIPPLKSSIEQIITEQR